MFDLWQKIETQRVRLRKITDDDLDFMFTHFRDEDVSRFLVDNEPVKTYEEAKEIIKWCNAQPETPTQNRWIIEWKKTNKAIGTVGFHCWDKTNNIAEIGYDLSKAYWNKGIMTEVLRKVVEFGFEHMGLNRIQAFVHIENAPSYYVLKNQGFIAEGIFRDKHFFRGKYYDHYCLSLLKRDFV